MYKPNFCVECGERIMRARWHLWTSRRFCPECAPRLRTARTLLPVLIGALLFGLGLGAGRGSVPAAPPLIIERGQPPATPAQATQAQPSANVKTGGTPAPATPLRNPLEAQTPSATGSAETVSICGAMTKKGTPCQRRVHGTGRCWQHQGMPAAIPLEARIIQGK
jgi:hypothetical protein